jgi:RNA 2',3'-cyclic 3'-phosphodiesterase
MRLFAAVPLPEPARGEVTQLLGRLRESALPVRWVKNEGVHLTLKFFGEVVPERLEVIEEAVRFASAGTKPLSLQLGELGAFPNPARPKVLWLGLESSPELELLQDRLERGGDAIGFPPEGTPFHPHVTLGRVREGQRCPSRWFAEFAGIYERLPFLATEVGLFESILTSKGPRYEARLTVELAA